MHRSRFSAPTPLQRAVATFAAIACASALAACADTLRPLGPTPAAAEANADQLFDALTTRFTPTEFSPRYDIVRVRLAQAALVPSRVFGDTSVWGAQPSLNARVLHISGGIIPSGKYRLDIVPALAPATKPGDSRHTVELQQIAGNEYRWDTDVALAIGGISAEGMSLLISSLLRGPEGRAERELRDDYRAAFPRAQVAWGRGFSIDSLRIAPGALGTTAVAVTVGFHPELMKPMYPALAGYVDKYLGPAKYHVIVADKSGVVLLDAIGRDRSTTVRYRIQQGALTSLFGPPRAWSDTLELRADATLKVKVFTVGFHELQTEFLITNTGHERSWTFIAQREPKWNLPLITERVIRSSLHRPFEGAGSMFRLDVHDSAGMQTMFSRRTRLEVQESAIMRFLGGLVSHALGELDAHVEAEEDRFLRDGSAAIQADLQALEPRWRVGAASPAGPP